MHDHLVRQSFLGDGSDRILGAIRVAIVGLGGGGSHVAQQLAHVGVGEFSLLDPDVVEESNLNRLVGATTGDVRRKTPKVVVAARLIGGVNPSARVTQHQARWQDHTELLRDCTVIVGCVDSFSERDQLEIAARRYLLPYVDIGMDVHKLDYGFSITGQVVLSMPGERCLRCFGVLTPELLAREAGQYGAAGGRPQVIWPNAILASTAVGLIIQLLTPWHSNGSASAYLEYDGNKHTFLPSNRFTIAPDQACKHFSSISTIGDPWWTPQQKTPHKTPAWLERLRRHFKG